MADFERWGEAVQIPISDLVTMPENPNAMDDVQFNQLVEMIEKHGFDEPLQVVPAPGQAGKYMIIGGEHRYKASKVLGMAKIPCVIKPSMEDEKVQKLEVVRRNMVRGELDLAKFNRLVRDIQTKHSMSLEEIKQGMGVPDKEWLRVLEKEKQKVDERAQEVLNDVRKEVQTVDNLSFLLNEIFSNFGSTVQQSFVFFFHKGKMHLMVQSSNELHEKVTKMVEKLKGNEKDINEHLLAALSTLEERNG